MILSGGTLGFVGAFAGLAKRLAPSLVVLEDVDLVAQERTFGPFGSSRVLFELMNELDGMGEDADVAWVLTTNRADALEPALAARPGRIDLAVELPLPDRDGRRRLLAALCEGTRPRAGGRGGGDRRDRWCPRLLHQGAAAESGARGGRGGPHDGDRRGRRGCPHRASGETSALTRVLRGACEPGAVIAPDPHGWMSMGQIVIE